MEKADRELMNITLEECAEVTQAISKVFRFGWDSTHPDTPNVSNKMHLEEEVGDLMFMLNLLLEKGILNETNVNIAFLNKGAKLRKWAPSIFER